MKFYILHNLFENKHGWMLKEAKHVECMLPRNMIA